MLNERIIEHLTLTAEYCMVIGTVHGIEAERKAIGRNVQLLQEMFERDAMANDITAISIVKFVGYE